MNQRRAYDLSKRGLSSTKRDDPSPKYDMTDVRSNRQLSAQLGRFNATFWDFDGKREILSLKPIIGVSAFSRSSLPTFRWTVEQMLSASEPSALSRPEKAVIYLRREDFLILIDNVFGREKSLFNLFVTSLYWERPDLLESLCDIYIMRVRDAPPTSLENVQIIYMTEFSSLSEESDFSRTISYPRENQQRLFDDPFP
ncbi:MAG: hypothetical protein Q9167_006548 [Letrouitia subvulpina]